MCGIFGYTGADYDPQLLEDMGKRLGHRGPDDVGYYVNKAAQIHFGLRRLSIIDLSGGHQPIPNEDNSISIACNGEIYNYVELRERLVEKGHRFSTKSDVEVLIHLYEEEGLDFLTDVNGMFGLVLYDSSIGRLILARDRLGIKPVYYAWNGKQFAFASEIKPLLLCPWISGMPDWHAISTYLNLLYVPSPGTCFDGIKKLESGTMAIVEKDNMHFRSYWKIGSYLDNPESYPMSLEDATGHLHLLLQDACRLQLRSDVPIGAFLSGGVDSSAVVALTNAHAPLSMDTFTIFWKDAPEKMDERGFAKEVSERYGSIHHEIPLTFDDFDRLLPLLVWHMEEPNADGAYVPTYVISEFARRKCKVILTGAGGDELFAGYGWYRSKLFSARQLIMPFFSKPGERAYLDRAFNFPWGLLIPSYLPGEGLNSFYNCYETLASRDIPNAQMVCDLKMWLQDDILLLTDKMSMATSLEARVPLLDHRIVEFLLTLPSSYKLTKSDNKVIFKKAVADYLPEAILNRKKDGFGAPINSWMQGRLKTVCLGILERGELMRMGIINRQTLQRLHYLLYVRKSWVWALWILLNLELWFRFPARGTSRPEGVRLSEL